MLSTRTSTGEKRRKKIFRTSRNCINEILSIRRE
jgi:hypothetical protein